MKKLTAYIPWTLTGIFILWVLVSLLPRKEEGFHYREFARLPVLMNGRIQPFDSVGRNSLLQIRARQSVWVEEEKDGRTVKREMPAAEWLVEVFMKPELANTRKIFRIDHPELLGMLGLPPNEKYFSFQQLRGTLEEIDRQTSRIRQKKQELWNPFEKQVMRLSNALTIFTRLKNSLKPEEVADFEADLKRFEELLGPGLEAVRAQHSGDQFDKEAFDAFLAHLQRYQWLSRVALPLVVPPQDPEQNPEAWENIGTMLMEAARRETLHPAIHYFAKMINAYRKGDVSGFNTQVAQYAQWLQEHKLHKELRKARWEFFYNDFAAFYKATTIYVLAFLLGCISWFNLSDWLRRSAFYLLFVALALHTTGLIFRMALEGRPPVTNLYSSAVFIGWGAVILGLVLERFFKDGIGCVTAGGIGFVTQIIAHNLALGGDTMEMLRAVLDTNFWLATHVVTITIGYSATFVAGFLGILYVLRGVFTHTLTWEHGRSLARMTYGIVCFATLFSFVGTVLGGIWADQSWGRFWGWDPKENGALIIVLWNAMILHARWAGLIQERGLMNMAIFGNVVTAFSWFGVNMLGIGLHSYGFMDAAFKWLMLFNASQILLIGLGMLPLRYWRSFQARAEAAAAAAASESKTAPAGA